VTCNLFLYARLGKEGHVGMNLFFVRERTVFLPTYIIIERLEHFRMMLRRSKFLERLQNFRADSGGKKDKRSDDISIILKKHKTIDDLTRSLKKNKRTADLARSPKKNIAPGHRFEDLDFLGYPKRPTNVSNDAMILLNTFEDTFGDTYGGGVWTELSETISSNISRNVVALASLYGETRIFACTGISSNISRNVVALASLYGETRIFACTGFFIEWNGCLSILTSASLVSDFVNDNKIFENLRIEVLLPTKQIKQGTIQHYNLRYNVALVSVKDFCASHPMDIEHQRCNRSR